MYCRQCGYNNDEYSKVCHRCGSIIREAENLYDEEETQEEALLDSGVLKYARKQEDIASLLKAPFRKLERANRKQKTSILAIISAAVAVLCLAVWITVVGVKACSREVEAVYGNTSANIAQRSLAAADSEYTYYSCPFGSNPGLYRMSESTGETLKISYLCMEYLSVADGWIYGVTQDGMLMRISTDGINSQQVIDELYVKQPTIVNGKLYYIGRECYLYCADLSTLTKRGVAKSVRVTNTRMTEFIVCDDSIYFIILSEEDYNELFTFSETRYRPDENGKENTKEENAYTYTEFQTPNGADIPIHAGCIMKILPDGSGESELLGTPVEKLSAANGYMYFQSEAVLTVSATVVDPKAPEDMLYDMPTTKCWRLELETLKYSSMLDIHVAASGMNPGDDGWLYYITVDGTLERTNTSGKERFDVLTYEQTVDRIAVTGSRIFAMCGGEKRLISIDRLSGEVELLCERAELPAAEDAPAE